MKTLVTGGAGFIGSNLVAALVEEKNEVSVLDNLITGKRENIPPGVPLYFHNIIEPEIIAATLKQVKPEIIFHLAGQIDVRKSIADPTFDAMTNVIGTINLLRGAIEARTKRFIFASTGGVIYGEPASLPAKETTPVVPLCAYGTAKACAEQYIAYFGRLYGLEAGILRYANVFGPRQNPHGEVGVIAIFMRQILAGETPVVYGDGEQTRDYVFVSDVVRANLLAAKGPCGTYNIGTGVEVSVNKILQTFERILGRPIKTEYRPARLGEARRIMLEASKAKRELDWQPEVSFEDGLASTLEWYQKQK